MPREPTESCLPNFRGLLKLEERKAISETMVDHTGVITAATSSHYLVKEFDGMVFELQFRATGEQGDIWTIDSMVLDGANGWSRTRLLGSLTRHLQSEGEFIDPLFPAEIVKAAEILKTRTSNIGEI